MSITVKDGVRFVTLTKEIWELFPVVEGVFKKYAPMVVPVITSANDSIHSKGSLHYSNRALDLRTKMLLPEQKKLVFNELALILKPAGYDVVFEGAGTDNEHLHIEYDPKE